MSDECEGKPVEPRYSLQCPDPKLPRGHMITEETKLLSSSPAHNLPFCHHAQSWFADIMTILIDKLPPARSHAFVMLFRTLGQNSRKQLGIVGETILPNMPQSDTRSSMFRFNASAEWASHRPKRDAQSMASTWSSSNMKSDC